MNFSSHAMADLGVQLSWLKFFFQKYEVYVSFMPISTWISFLVKYMFFRLIVLMQYHTTINGSSFG